MGGGPRPGSPARGPGKAPVCAWAVGVHSMAPAVMSDVCVCREYACVCMCIHAYMFI